MKCYSAYVILNKKNESGLNPIVVEICNSNLKKAENEAKSYIKDNKIDGFVTVEETTEKYM